MLLLLLLLLFFFGAHAWYIRYDTNVCFDDMTQFTAKRLNYSATDELWDDNIRRFVIPVEGLYIYFKETTEFYPVDTVVEINPNKVHQFVTTKKLWFVTVDCEV